MKTETLRFKQTLYPKEALLKAAYHFLDRFYVHVDCEGEEYLVTLTKKRDEQENISLYEFENELLAQTVRHQIYRQTHTIREILMARAMSSTLTGDSSEYKNAEIPDRVDELESIVKDWFEKNEG